MNFQKARVDKHNCWPTAMLFKAEQEFADLLVMKHHPQVFEPVHLQFSSDANFQVLVGHLIDGIECLPTRPDYLFDHCFRVIDKGATPLFSKGGKAIVQGLGGKLTLANQKGWNDILKLLADAMPFGSYKYVAKRICYAHVQPGIQNEFIRGRAKDFFGEVRYDEFMDKFAVPPPVAPQTVGAKLKGKPKLSNPPPVDAKKIDLCASFLKLYISGSFGGKPKNPATHTALDMTRVQNQPKDKKRIEFFLSLLLFTSRNERAHGSMLSPFRTSKADVERYERFYFSALVAYIFALGVIDLQGAIAIPVADIKAICARNLQLQKYLFT
ncbi:MULTISPECIES: hypothetical protein [Janthinobacterium]|uniref:Uncharacterized protein n=1 Tax=Janthinobacterium kumbetense TaxID=2950280 RepID=A0ABT0WLG4_9BURK|nr:MULTISPECIES: hypothetical protein [Janthinobacterium]MCM2564911.1 hypothetical protein [Janthinobacterium kumbetense]MDN2676333.1 hypothetical protein [Janthinobacterium sp. SUN033]